MTRILVVFACLAAAAPAAAQPRTPPERQQLVQLAYTLGESHYLRTLCRGPDDQTWRARMSRMVDVEAPDEDFRRRLVDSFNSGYVTMQARHPTCERGAREEAKAAAARGRQRAAALSRGT